MHERHDFPVQLHGSVWSGQSGLEGPKQIFLAFRGPLYNLRTRVCAKRPTEQKMTPILRKFGGSEKWLFWGISLKITKISEFVRTDFEIGSGYFRGAKRAYKSFLWLLGDP